MNSAQRTWDLRTTTVRAAGVVILTLSGRLSSTTSRTLARALEDARGESPRIIVDLAGVDYVSGAGLTVLHDASNSGGELIVCNLSEPVRIAVDLAGLLEELTIEPSRESALAKISARQGHGATSPRRN